MHFAAIDWYIVVVYLILSVLVGLLGAAVAHVITIAWGEPPLSTAPPAAVAPAGRD